MRTWLVMVYAIGCLSSGCLPAVDHPASSDERYLVQAIDWSLPNLLKGAMLLTAGDTSSALDVLLELHKEADMQWLYFTWDSMPDTQSMVVANDLLLDTVLLYNMRCKIPASVRGGWQWNYTGPDPDDEFGYALNGHKYLRALYDQYRISGEAHFGRKLLDILADWIATHPLPLTGDSIYLVYDPEIRLDYRDLGEVEWRTLEMGHRLGTSWPQVYYGMARSPLFPRNRKIRFLASLARQADFLKKHHKRGHNWTTMEMNGLALVGLAFPEFVNSKSWAAYALQTMEGEIIHQVYPDGAQVELAAKTQWVALRRFESIADNFSRAGVPINLDYRSRLEEMYNYMAYSLRPDGHHPLNSDADREDLTEYILIAADKFDRPDWHWIISNGREGVPPSKGPSLVFPWAGVGILRGGWDLNAQWLFFDAGAYGTGHQHRDKLHLSLSAYGHDLLVDAGRYTHEDYFSFDPRQWRGYFRSSHAHNVMLVNGAGQMAYKTRATEPLTDGKDYLVSENASIVRSSFAGGFEEVDFEVEHRRSVFHLLNTYVVVIDEVSSEAPCTLEFLWHFHPGISVFETEQGLEAKVDSIKLQLLVSEAKKLSFRRIKGQTAPKIQGWYSETYGWKEANATAVYTRNIHGNLRQAWLLSPGLEDKAELSWSVTFDSSYCRIQAQDLDSHQWHLPLYNTDASSINIH